MCTPDLAILVCIVAKLLDSCEILNKVFGTPLVGPAQKNTNLAKSRNMAQFFLSHTYTIYLLPKREDFLGHQARV